jgi:hypothetical protein
MFYMDSEKCYKLNFFTILYKNYIHTSKETHYFSATETNRLVLFRERIPIYCENRAKHTNTLCGQNSEF